MDIDVAARSLRALELEQVLERVCRHAIWERGKQAVRGLRPLIHRDDVLDRQAEVAEALRLDEMHATPPMRGVREVGALVEGAARGQVLEPQGLLDVAQTARVAIAVRRFLIEKGDAAPRLTQRASGLVDLPRVVEEVGRCLTSDGGVKDEASARLEGLRIQLRTLQNRIQSKLTGYLRNPAYARMFQEPYVTTRQDRYVLPIKADYRGQFPGLVLDASASGATVFMEPWSVTELSNEMRTTRASEVHEIEQILAKLSQLAGSGADDMLANLEVLGELDMLFAVAGWAAEHRCRLPLIDEDPHVDLRGARHPLLEGRAVPIDVQVGRGFRVLVITGPNTGGKTVTLKTVGLLALLALCGLPIPARDESRVGFLDSVFADIGDEQSIQQNLSTFSSHMGQVAKVLERAGERSLVLLDEAGAGTDPREGTSLAVAIMEHFYGLGALVVTTTHHGELKAFASNFAGASNAAMEFDPETLMPTYHVRMGLPGRSCALEIASRLGLPAPVLERARELLGASHFSVEDLLSDLEIERDATLRRQEQARRALEEAETTRRHAEDRLRSVNAERERRLRETGREADALIEAARKEARGLIRDARARVVSLCAEISRRAPTEEAPSQGEPEAAPSEGETEAAPASQAEAMRDLDRMEGALQTDLKALGEAVDETLEAESERVHEEEEPASAEAPREPLLLRRRQSDGPGLEPGDAVFIPRLGQSGTVADPPRGGEVRVQVGRMHMTLPLRDVEKADRPLQPAPSEGDAAGTRESPAGEWLSRSVSRAATLVTRLNLIGMRAEDAAYALGRYLDEVANSGVGEVTIVHGKGAGVLQKVVAEVLRSHPEVASFRRGEIAEGGAGVTVATLGAADS